MQDKIISGKQTEGKSMLLAPALLSAGFYPLLKHLFRGDAYPDHNKIHTAALVYAGCETDSDFIKKYNIRSKGKIAQDVQCLVWRIVWLLSNATPSIVASTSATTCLCRARSTSRLTPEVHLPL